MSDVCMKCGTEKQHIPDLGQTWTHCPKCQPEYLDKECGCVVKK